MHGTPLLTSVVHTYPATKWGLAMPVESVRQPEQLAWAKEEYPPLPITRVGDKY